MKSQLLKFPAVEVVYLVTLYTYSRYGCTGTHVCTHMSWTYFKREKKSSGTSRLRFFCIAFSFCDHPMVTGYSGKAVFLLISLGLSSLKYEDVTKRFLSFSQALTLWWTVNGIEVISSLFSDSDVWTKNKKWWPVATFWPERSRREVDISLSVINWIFVFPQHSLVEILPLNVMIWGGGTFERLLGH